MNPRRAFWKQKANAKLRGIAWDFDFDSWLKVWIDSGKFSLRGRGTGRYVMARIGDSGPYSRRNVEIIPFEKNSGDARSNNPRTLQDLRAQTIGRGRGWTLAKGAYQVYVSKKYIGRFKTIPEAEAAYRAAVIKLTQECATR